MDVNGRALKVRADLDNAALKLRPGLLVRVTVKGAPRRAVTVPEAAIVPRGSQTVVFITDKNTAREAKVSTGRYAGGVVEIVSGVEAGQEVVIAGNTRLSNGAAIEIVAGHRARPTEALMTLPELCIRRPVFATVMSLILLLVGFMAFSRLTIREYPNIDEPQVSVATSYTGASAEIMESQVTQVLEGSLAGIEGIDTIESTSRAESSRITIRFRAGVDIDTATSDVRDRVSRIRRTLPDEIDEPTISKVEADAQPIMFLIVRSGQPGHARADRLCRPLRARPVQEPDRGGGRDHQWRAALCDARVDRCDPAGGLRADRPGRRERHPQPECRNPGRAHREPRTANSPCCRAPRSAPPRSSPTSC